MVGYPISTEASQFLEFREGRGRLACSNTFHGRAAHAPLGHMPLLATVLNRRPNGPAGA